MDIKKGQELREKWGDKECDHPSFERETHGHVFPFGYVEEKTGDYLCSICGAVFTGEERDKIETNRAKSEI